MWVLRYIWESEEQEEIIAGILESAFDAEKEEKPDREEEKPEDRPILITRRPTIEEILRILRGEIGRSPIRTIRLEFDLDDGIEIGELDDGFDTDV